MKITIKSLEKRIEKLEFHEKNTIKILEDVDDRLNKLEMLHDPKSGIRHEEPTTKYQVGDYVEFYDKDRLKQQGKIINIFCDGTYGIMGDNYGYYIKESKIIGYAKPGLLTPEEKEYLSVVIKPFRDEVMTICLTMNGDEYIRIQLKGYCNFLDIPVYRKDGLVWKLPLNNEYTLEELGL